MERRRLLTLSLAITTMLLPGFVTASAASHGEMPAAPPPLPNSIAAIGDSISQAMDSCCWFGDHPQYSWSTGDAADAGVVSHYQRILRVHPAISGHALDDAVSGSMVADTNAQAAAAVRQQAEYVTMLIGANDVCTGDIGSMTPAAQFQRSFATTMQTLELGLPHAHILVSSIPDIYQLWSLLHTDGVAEFVWAFAGICRSMTSPLNTEADRQAVVRQEVADNAVMATVCRRYANCRWDDLASYTTRFTTGDVSSLDYFHPSRSGQALIASATWPHSWWPRTP